MFSRSLHGNVVRIVLYRPTITASWILCFGSNLS